jgi:hypothetical protein
MSKASLSEYDLAAVERSSQPLWGTPDAGDRKERLVVFDGLEAFLDLNTLKRETEDTFNHSETSGFPWIKVEEHVRGRLPWSKYRARMVVPYLSETAD